MSNSYKQNKEVIFKDLGSIDYKEAWDYQLQLHKEIVDLKLENRKVEEQIETHNYLIFCEHEPVFTLGKSGKIEHLLLSEEELKKRGFSFYKINRGGDITYHGPGQIMGYPILDLENFKTDLHLFFRNLEEVMIRVLAEYGIEAGRIKGLTGVWINPEHPTFARKICAFGAHCSRWVTMHGWSLNVNSQLNHFGHIIPCGIKDKQVTSMQKELGYELNVEEVKGKIKKHFSSIFEAVIV